MEFNEDLGIFFKQTFKTEVNAEQIENFKNKYNELDNKNDYQFEVYIKTSDGYGPSSYMHWTQIRKETLEKWMNRDKSCEIDL
jgi:hypothetical protein